MYKEARKSNIELLRIIIIFGVIVLHYNRPAVTGETHITINEINLFVLNIFESIFVSAVNIFILISGYFMCTSLKRNAIKPFKLLIQVIAFKEFAIILSAIIHQKLSLRSIVGGLIPNNYFVILYIALYFISPYINITLQKLSKKKFENMIIILMLIFSIWNCAADVVLLFASNEIIGISTIGIWGSQDGYTIVNFCLMYILGAYIRLHGKQYKTSHLLIAFSLCTCVILVWSMLHVDTAYAYCNPFVIIQAVIVFKLFNNMNIKQNKVINKISKGTFTVFLTHSYLYRLFYIEKQYVLDPFCMTLCLLATCLIIFIICYLVYLVYDIISSPIYKLFENKIKTIEINLED